MPPWDASLSIKVVTLFNNNCSTEALDLLKTALPESQELDQISSWVETPTGLMDQLIAEQMVDPVQFRTENSLYRYYFPSYLKTSQRAFNQLMALVALPKEMKIKDYLELSAKMRMSYYITAKAKLDPATLIAANNAFYQLELSERDHLASYLQNQFKNILSRLGRGEPVPGISRDVIVKIKEHLIYRSRLAPKLMAESGYGIPIHFDFDEMIHSADYRGFQRTLSDLRQMAESIFPKIFEQSEATQKNIKFLVNDSAAQSGVSIQKNEIIERLSVMKSP